MSDDFDPTPYVRPPVLDVAGGVALGIALLSAAPESAPPNVHKAALKVRKETLALQDAWARSESSPGRRKVDMRLDNAWGILLDRLVAYASLPAALFPLATRAREIVDSISPNDRESLVLPHGSEWAESARRLKKIDSARLLDDVEELAGPEFLLEVRQAHKLHGAAIGVIKGAERAPEVNLADPLRALARAIGRYGTAVAGLIDDDPATLAVVRNALKPLDDYREAQARRNSGNGPAEAPAPATPTTPVPEVK